MDIRLLPPIIFTFYSLYVIMYMCYEYYITKLLYNNNKKND